MAGTMSKDGLKINCGMTIGATVESLVRNTNAAAMTLSGNTLYLAKAHANENGKVVYKSMILKSDKFASEDIGKDEKVAEINYFVYGMTATADRLYCTCKNASGESGILEMKMDTSGQKFTKLNATYVGINTYKDGKFILMKQLDGDGTKSMKFVTGNLNELKNGTGINFTVNANDATDYNKANDIYYDCNQGLFILTNHYLDTDRYKKCQNRILLVKPGTYIEGKIYYPHAAFQVNLDTKTYSQFNFEGIILYKNNIWVLSNTVITTGTKEADCIGYMPGITFKKCDESVDEEGNGYFSFKGSTTTGASLPTKNVNNVLCPNVQGMAIDENNVSYCLKCDSKNQYAVLFKTSTPESGTASMVVELGKTDDTKVYHCNGMTYNPDDKKMYIIGYKNNTDIHKIFRMENDGVISQNFETNENKYGITYYGKNKSTSEFILMEQLPEGNPLKFDKAILNNDTMTIEEL